MRGFLIWCAMALPLPAAFAPPAEGPAPFRRDRLPVDVDTMTALSRQVTALAGAAETGEPAGRRQVAQAAALALALDPANRQARELIAAAEKGEKPAAPGEGEIEQARSRAWQTLSWLEMPEAGAEGNALAACLGDVLAAADPRHPKAQAWGGEKGAWKNWVAEAEAFETKSAPVEPEPEPEEEEKTPKTPALALATVPGRMPAQWMRDRRKTGATTLVTTFAANVLVKLEGSISEEREGVSWELAGDDGSRAELLARTLRPVEAALKSRHGSLPEGLVLKIDAGKDGYDFELNGPALTGTAALLLDGALSGKAPAVATLAVVGEGGKLELPPKFWPMLRTLATFPDNPGRPPLVLPEAAAPFLIALVTMDDAAFFMHHEVLLAGTVDELCELAAGGPGGTVAEACAAFAEIRRAGEGRGLGSFVAHPSTQQRLGQVVSLLPAHASARLLALQGSGNRPRFLDRKILAREMRGALEPLAYLEGRGVERIDPLRLDRIHESSRALLDKMPGYIDTRDRDLHKQVVSAVDSLRTLARAMRLNNPEKIMEIRARRTDALKNAHGEYVRLMAELTAAAGDQAEYKMPPPVGDQE